MGYEKAFFRSLIPEDLTSGERAYYREVWGFDPVTDKVQEPLEDFGYAILAPQISYFYQASIPLENDEELNAAGVMVYARVEVDTSGESHNRIIFIRGKQTAGVECVHTTVFAGTLQELERIPEEKIKELTRSTEGSPTIITSWEHFAALKSFVGGITSVGFFSLLDPSNPLGLNPALLAQISQALIKIAPEVMSPRLMQVFGDIIENESVQWLIKNWDFIATSYNALVLLKNSNFIDSLENRVQQKLVELLISLEMPNEKDLIEILNLLLKEEYVPTLPVPTQHRILEFFIKFILNSMGFTRQRLMTGIHR